MKNETMEGRKREERVGELRSVAHHKRGLTNWRGGRGRSGLVSFETWHVTSEDSTSGGEEEGGGSWRTRKHGRTEPRRDGVEGREEAECVSGTRAHVGQIERL